ncbi:hypothetical protein GCM10009654_14350 [Streptomyces hebeiensis]|uniref:Transposase n=1 Tax=Streptomyces hebeiensis TaxID=229486 RepID=A0ABN1UQ68_9ACTN
MQQCGQAPAGLGHAWIGRAERVEARKKPRPRMSDERTTERPGPVGRGVPRRWCADVVYLRNVIRSADGGARGDCALEFAAR